MKVHKVRTVYWKKLFPLSSYTAYPPRCRFYFQGYTIQPFLFSNPHVNTYFLRQEVNSTKPKFHIIHRKITQHRLWINIAPGNWMDVIFECSHSEICMNVSYQRAWLCRAKFLQQLRVNAWRCSAPCWRLGIFPLWLLLKSPALKNR